MAAVLEEFESLLVLGLCYKLHDLGVGWYEERTPGVVAENPTPATLPTIFPASDMPETPDRALTVNLYNVTDPQSVGLLDVGRFSVQFRCRVGEDPLEVTEFVGQIRRAFHKRRYINLGRVRSSIAILGSIADLGPDRHTPPRREVTANIDFTGSRFVRPVE